MIGREPSDLLLVVLVCAAMLVVAVAAFWLGRITG